MAKATAKATTSMMPLGKLIIETIPQEDGYRALTQQALILARFFVEPLAAARPIAPAQTVSRRAPSQNKRPAQRHQILRRHSMERGHALIAIRRPEQGSFGKRTPHQLERSRQAPGSEPARHCN